MPLKQPAKRQFHFLRQIARGGFGSVYLAKLTQADEFSRLVAVKLLHTQWSEDGEIASRLRDEARLLGRLRHKHIVNVYDLTRIDGRTALVMEYLEAVDLKAVVRDTKRQQVRIPLRVGMEISACVASALDAAYNNPPYAGERPLRVIHRDIKPSNIMLDCHGTVKVLDFGVAWADFDQRESKTEELSFGSIDYMSPERICFDPDTPSSDVYSLGCTLYELVAQQKLGKAKLGKREHDAFIQARLEEIPERHPMPSEEVRAQLTELLTSMLAFRESDRPSAGDCVSRLRRIAKTLSGHPTLEEWSEKRVTALVKEQEAQRGTEKGRGSLRGRVLTEDSGWMPAGHVGPTHSAPPRPVVNPNLSRPAHTAPVVAHGGSGAALAGGSMEDDDVPTVVLSNPDLVAVGLAAGMRAHSPVQPRRSAMGAWVCVALGALFLLSGGAATALAGGAAVYMYTQDGAFPTVLREVPDAEGEIQSQGLASDVTPLPASSGGRTGRTDASTSAHQDVGQARFVSRLHDTRKMRVDCAGATGKGEKEVTLTGSDLGDCRISAQRRNRTIATAVVKDAEPRVYRCFSGGEARCE